MAAMRDLAYIARLALRLRALRPDLVHTNSLKAGVYGSLAARAAGVPVVWHVRDRIAEDYIPRAAVRLVRTLIRHLADGVIANSTATLQTLPPGVQRRDELGDPRPRSRLRPIRMRRARPLGPALATDRRAKTATTFGMLGRIAPWKGQDLFLRAFAAAFPKGEERAVMVGTTMFGEEELRAGAACARGEPRNRRAGRVSRLSRGCLA